ncbi:hypothetical protein EDC30_104278 [Paucimonas lemoignei]|uniref:Phage terminase Nu1 subunit (DNA packaging protein) n=1 Tax=Paucimonas lemoignei TaxID=29443 RepID=A0A4R3HXD0_PAULE|nr:hypothetical protein [Paucimonas lemoignei]TCS37474.1 hypothetical protein EDC30_104278 [Paucimonas lemoignei]
MAELITKAAYARRRGVSPAAVTKAVKSGRITEIDGKIDPDVADIQWSRNTDVAQSARTSDSILKSPTSTKESRQEGQEDSAILVARTRTEIARAELFEIEIAEKRGTLVLAEGVKKAAFEKARIVRSALEGLPDRLAPVLAAETDPARCHQLMMAEIKRVLRELAAGEGEQTRQ